MLTLSALAAVFLPRGSEASRAPAAEAAEYGGARSWDGPGYDELFADAACADSVTDFAALMSAGYVKAIVVGGSLTLTAGAEAENRGVLDLYDGDAVLEADALADFDGADGVILGRFLAGRVNTDVFGKVWDADFTPIDGDVRRTEVTSAGEFLAALADPDSGTIVVTGGVNLAESVTLTKHVFVESGSLLVRAGNSLTVDGAIFCVNGMLCCDGLRVTGGGMAEIIGEWRGLTDESRISVSDGSWVYTRESILPLDEINVDATSMMLYSPAGGPSVSAHNARLRVGQLDSVSRPVTCRAVFPTLWGRVAKHGPGSKKG